MSFFEIRKIGLISGGNGPKVETKNKRGEIIKPPPPVILVLLNYFEKIIFRNSKNRAHIGLDARKNGGQRNRGKGGKGRERWIEGLD